MDISTGMNVSFNNIVLADDPGKKTISQKSQRDDMRDNFLKMIVKQMQNQDPTKPLDNTELTSQLVQIATLESMDKLNDNVSGISQQISSGQSLQATQLVGKGVLIPRNEIMLGHKKTSTFKNQYEIKRPSDISVIQNEHSTKEQLNENASDYISSPFGFHLSKNAENVEVVICDKNRNVIRNFYYDQSMKADIYDLYWDGKDNQGNPVLDINSKYFFDVKAVNNGIEIATTKLGYTRVNGVISGKEMPLLDTGIGQSIPLSHIFKVYPTS